MNNASHALDSELVSDWFDEGIKWFAHNKSCCLTQFDLAEYALIGTVEIKDPRAHELKRRWFTSICHKCKPFECTSKGVYAILCLTLEAVDADLFSKDPTHLLKLTDQLFLKLNSGVYTRDTFNSLSIIMQCLQRCFSLLREVNPSLVNPHDKTGRHADFCSQLDKIASNQDFYPFAYQVEMLKQGLRDIEDRESISPSYIACQHVLETSYGILCLATFTRKLTTLEFDHAALSRGIKVLESTKRSGSIRKLQWHQWIDDLRTACELCIENPINYRTFEKLFDYLDKKTKGFVRVKNSKALRFGMLDQLVFLTRTSSKEVQNKAVHKLLGIGERCTENDPWSKDADIYEALLDSVMSLYEFEETEEQVKKILYHLLSLQDPKLKQRATDWLRKEPLSKKLEDRKNELSMDEVSKNLFQKFVEHYNKRYQG